MRYLKIVDIFKKNEEYFNFKWHFLFHERTENGKSSINFRFCQDNFYGDSGIEVNSNLLRANLFDDSTDIEIGSRNSPEMFHWKNTRVFSLGNRCQIIK